MLYTASFWPTIFHEEGSPVWAAYIAILQCMILTRASLSALELIIIIYGDLLNWHIYRGRVYTSPVLNEWSIKKPASRYIKNNRLLQQCRWPITFDKTCIWISLSNSRHNVGNGAIWTGGSGTWLCAGVAFYLEFTKKLSKRVYPPRAMALVGWILCPLVGVLRHVSLI